MVTESEKDIMTDRQLENRKQEIRNQYSDLSTRFAQEQKEGLWAIEMINSILAYAPMSIHSTTIIDYVVSNSYMKKYIDTFGEQKIKTFVVNQINSIQCIEKNVYTDCDGISYNSIKWLE